MKGIIVGLLFKRVALHDSVSCDLVKFLKRRPLKFPSS